MRTNHDSISNVDNFGANGGPPVVKHESGVDSKSEIWTLSGLKTIRGEHRPVERSPVRCLHGRSAAIHACMIQPIAEVLSNCIRRRNLHLSINLHDLGWNSQWQDRFETFVQEVLSIPPITTSTSPQNELPTLRIGPWSDKREDSTQRILEKTVQWIEPGR